MVPLKRYRPTRPTVRRGRRWSKFDTRPTFFYRKPQVGSNTTHVILGGAGLEAASVFGCVDARYNLDPTSYAGRLPDEDGLLFVRYAPQHVDEVLFEGLIGWLQGDVEIHALSAGAGIAWRLSYYCEHQLTQSRRANDLHFDIRRITYINPAVGLAGLWPDPRRAAQVCRLLNGRRVTHSTRLLRLWGGQDTESGLCRKVWPELPGDRALAKDLGREAQYDLYREAQRDSLPSTVVSVSAGISTPAFTGVVEQSYSIIVIRHGGDDVVDPNHNAHIIAQHYRNGGAICFFDVTGGDTRWIGGHDSSLVLQPGRYFAAYQDGVRQLRLTEG